MEGEGERGAVCGNTHVDDVEARDKEAGKHTLRLGEAEAPDYHSPAARTRHTRSPLPIPPLDRPGRALAARSPPRQAAQCLMCEGAGSFSTVCPHQPIQPMVIPGLHARELGGGMEGGDEGGSQWDAGPGTRREGGAGSWDVPDKRETLPWGRSWRSGRQTGQNTTNE